MLPFLPNIFNKNSQLIVNQKFNNKKIVKPQRLKLGDTLGVIAPSRDMLVRNAAPAGTAGRAFGIVSTGFNFSGILSPLLYGWIMDQNMPHWVFGASVGFMVLTVLLALVTDRKSL